MGSKYLGMPTRVSPEPRWDVEVGLDLTQQPKWNIPDIVVIEAAVCGHPIKRATNPHHPYTPDEIRKEAMECIEAGAAAVHLHVRDDQGNIVTDTSEYLRKLHLIIDPIRKKYGDNVVIDGCALLPSLEGEEALIESGLFELSPVNCYCASPSKLVQAETQIMQRNRVKPQIAIYSDGDLDRAKKWLIDTRIVEKPFYWIYLPTYLTGCTPMPNEFAMVESLLWQVRRMREIDPKSLIMICSSGRASSYLTVMSMIMGLHVRVGMEDTVFRWPHKDDLMSSNAKVITDTITMAKLLGRRPATANEYRVLMGLPIR